MCIRDRVSTQSTGTVEILTMWFSRSYQLEDLETMGEDSVMRLRIQAQVIFDQAMNERQGDSETLTVDDIKKFLQKHPELKRQLKLEKQWNDVYRAVEVDGDRCFDKEQWCSFFSLRMAAPKPVGTESVISPELAELSPTASPSPRRAITGWKSTWGMPPESADWPEWKKRKWVWQHQPERVQE
eukprot:TRINITY_DN19266_c0_g1_i4.p1 TRINITY_DN19266_c0_g1~~TRINITY_DN19266_c0_g1_i4.p1  ORF type:complete len:184 (+),score=60.85 TRINITY_DN19266_c0_g1_i4:143-694(+)